MEKIETVALMAATLAWALYDAVENQAAERHSQLG